MKCLETYTWTLAALAFISKWKWPVWMVRERVICFYILAVCWRQRRGIVAMHLYGKSWESRGLSACAAIPDLKAFRCKQPRLSRHQLPNFFFIDALISHSLFTVHFYSKPVRGRYIFTISYAFCCIICDTIPQKIAISLRMTAKIIKIWTTFSVFI